MTLFERVTIAVRGTAYGAGGGAACGALGGGALPLALEPVSAGALRDLPAAAFFGALFGTMFGLAIGAVGGIAFAIAAPWLAGRPRATRLAGAALAPGVLIAAWLILRTAVGQSVLPTARELPAVGWGYFLPAWIGSPVGAFVAPLVLYGARKPRDPRRRAPVRPGGVDAAS